ncbi:MAG TPA: DUF1440 domain-containing protein [Thermoanaerobaculia bacterium]|nr:DUF1440 domain-containing protein [Thermoanaerobaculia bacterium]
MRNLATDLLIGIGTAAAATWLMDKATSALYERENPFAKQREDSARGGKSAYENAAERWLGDKKYGNAIHWALGLSAGALYAGLRHNSKKLHIGSGLLYGALFFATMDEGVNTALKLTPPPKAFPWQTHARGLAGHLLLGGLLEAPFDILDAAA